MAGFAIKVKTKSGQQIVKNLTPDTTIRDLKSLLSNISDIPVHRLHVLSGFPPKILDLSGDSLSLCASGIISGDTLILEEKAVSEQESRTSAPRIDASRISGRNETPEDRQNVNENQHDCPGILMKFIVPADNSCLFTSIHFVLNGKVDETGSVAPWMRQIIAETISKDTESYSEAILGKSNEDYSNWILDDKSWGGAIELAVLSNYYGIEIAVVDTINAIINRFGEDQNYPHRVFLLFDGIHYDPLYLEPFEGGSIRTMFSSEDVSLLREAEILAKEAKSSRQFTDVNKFTLKCLVCNILISGQVQAQQHAQSTGHMSFGEV